MPTPGDEGRWVYVRPTDPAVKVPIESDDKDDCLVKVYQDVPASLKATVSIAANQTVIAAQTVAANLKVEAAIAAAAEIIVKQTVAANLKVEAVIAAAQEIIAKQTVAANLKATVTQDSDLRTVQSKDSDKIEGIESIVEQQVLDNDVLVNDDHVTGTPVDSDKIWKITHVTMIYTGTVPNFIVLYVVGLATNLYIMRQNDPVSGWPYVWTGEIYMQDGDYFRLEVNGSTAGDDLKLNYAGIQMNVP